MWRAFGIGRDRASSAGDAAKAKVNARTQISRGSGSSSSASRSAKSAMPQKSVSRKHESQKAKLKKTVSKKKIPKASTAQKDKSTCFSASHWGLPTALTTKLDSWGSAFVRVVWECGRVALAASGLSATWPSQNQLHVGTDCSGAEAPIWALRAMGIAHVHKYSCDIQAGVRRFIQATSPPQGPIYTDMLARDLSDMPAHSIYCCGFPCKAFSSLRRHSTKLLKEASAKPFFAVLKVIRHHMPLIAVLENVRGIRIVFRQVFAHLKTIAGYFIFVVPIDSVDLGVPISRPRYYFILIRQDVAVSGDVSFLTRLVKNMYSAARSDVSGHVSDMMLPTHSAAVREFALKRSRSVAFGSAGVQGGAKTCEFGLTPRQQLVLESARKKCREAGGNDVIINVSQSEGRATLRFNGISPTLTPGGCVVVDRARRVIVPIEKLMLHGFPIHRMKIPTSTSATQLASLGGNTMHVKCVGLALLMGIALVNWSHSSARPGAEPFQGKPVPSTSVVLPFEEVSDGQTPKAKTTRRRRQSKKIAK